MPLQQLLLRCQPPLLLLRHKFSQSHQLIAWPSGGLAS